MMTRSPSLCNTRNGKVPSAIVSLLNWPSCVQAQILDAVRKQIDYYFSVANLVKDVYLRSNMDDNGWIPLTVGPPSSFVHNVPILLLHHISRQLACGRAASLATVCFNARALWVHILMRHGSLGFLHPSLNS